MSVNPDGILSDESQDIYPALIWKFMLIDIWSGLSSRVNFLWTISDWYLDWHSCGPCVIADCWNWQLEWDLDWHLFSGRTPTVQSRPPFRCPSRNYLWIEDCTIRLSIGLSCLEILDHSRKYSFKEFQLSWLTIWARIDLGLLAMKDYPAFPKNSTTTQFSPSDCLISYQGHSL